MTAHIDPRHLRETLACFPTGVAVATTLSQANEPIGVTISSFNSVSMAPPLVLWSLAKTASSLAAYREASGFAINILSAEQADLARLFAGRTRARFETLDWHSGLLGHPVLPGCAAVLECRTHAIHDGGDHEIFLGEVLDHNHTDQVPLVFGKGQLGALALVS